MKKDKKTLNLKNITKSVAWSIQENDVFRLLETAEKDVELKENISHYLDILRSAFDIEVIKIDKPEVVKKYEARGYKTALIKGENGDKRKLAVKKHTITKVTDLTYDNIKHISASKLTEILERNFGGGWDSLSQSTKDIIESTFDISTTTLPKERLHKAGGMYDKKIIDGYETLEIKKGNWVEAIFIKLKTDIIITGDESEEEDVDKRLLPMNDSDIDNQTDEIFELNDSKQDDEDETYDEEILMEESYHTTFENNEEDIDMTSSDLDDEDFEIEQ